VHAYIDETIISAAGLPTKYLLCAALIAPEVLATQREIVRGFSPRNKRKLHWHDARLRHERLQMLRVVASLEVSFVIAITDGYDDESEERLRRRALVRLIAELNEKKVTRMTFESRGPAVKKDKQLVNTLRFQRQMRPELRVSHVAGPEEPLLWLPDIVCGLERNLSAYPEMSELIKRSYLSS
jgi:hypothetical protein